MAASAATTATPPFASRQRGSIGMDRSSGLYAFDPCSLTSISRFLALAPRALLRQTPQEGTWPMPASMTYSRQARLLKLDGAREPRTRRSEAWRLSPHSIPQNLAAWPTSAKRVPPDGGYG